MYTYVRHVRKNSIGKAFFGFDPQGIIEAINVRLVKQGAIEYALPQINTEQKPAVGASVS